MRFALILQVVPCGCIHVPRLGYAECSGVLCISLHNLGLNVFSLSLFIGEIPLQCR